MDRDLSSLLQQEIGLPAATLKYALPGDMERQKGVPGVDISKNSLSVMSQQCI